MSVKYPESTGKSRISSICGSAPRTAPHSPPGIGYSEWLGWSRTTWNFLPLTIQRRTAS